MTKLKKGFTEVNIDQLVKADWNYKQDNPVLMEKLKSNIKRNGLVENLLIRELETGFYEVVNGNHRLDALGEIGWDKPVVVFNFGDISTVQAQRIAIETNETKFQGNDVKLAELIVDLAEEWDKEDLLESMPFSSNELDVFIELTNFDFSDFDDPPPGEEEGKEADKNKLEVTLRFRTEDQLDEFNNFVANLKGRTAVDKLLGFFNKHTEEDK